MLLLLETVARGEKDSEVLVLLPDPESATILDLRDLLSKE